MKKFQTGGLAAVTPPPDAELEEEDTMSPVAAAVAEEVVPDPLSELRGMAKMNRDTAITQLRAAQGEFQQRRERQNQRAQQDKWLAFAQSMLAPTRTGAFGESLGMAAGSLREQSAQQAEIEAMHAAEEQRFADREMAIAGDYFDALTNLEGFKSNSRARVVGTTTAIDPADIPAIDAGEMTEAEANRVIVSMIMNPDGTTVARVERDAQNRPFRIVDPRRVPSQAAAQRVAETTATSATNSAVDQAKVGIQAIPALGRLQRAYGMMEGLTEDTSGLNEIIRNIAQFAGISEAIDDNTTLATLQSMMGRQVLADLRLLTGTKTDFEYQKVEGMNANLGQNVEENLAILREQLSVLGEIIDKGEFAAQNLSEGPGTEERDFWLDQYTRFRASQAELTQEREAARMLVAPPEAQDYLLEQLELTRGNTEAQKLLLDQFQQNFEIPDELAVPIRQTGAPY